MKQVIPQHVVGDDLSDALDLLQQLAETSASGSLKTAAGLLRLRDGRVVKVVGSILSDLVAGAASSWGWRTVKGSPNGDLNVELSSALLSAFSA
tara:strand:- start:3204 stop:3485 length:282 start_codon:yes stop_codon:yes gene_type:complete